MISENIIITEFKKFTDFRDPGLKALPQTFVLQSLEPRAEIEDVFTIPLTFKSFSIMKMRKSENMKSMFPVKVLTLSGTGKG